MLFTVDEQKLCPYPGSFMCPYWSLFLLTNYVGVVHAFHLKMYSLFNIIFLVLQTFPFLSPFKCSESDFFYLFESLFAFPRRSMKSYFELIVSQENVGLKGGRNIFSQFVLVILRFLSS